MQERIRIRFTRDGAPLPVSRLDANAGLVFAYESSAEPLGFGIGLEPGNVIVANAMATVRQVEDWRPEEFRLAVTRDGNSLVISGGGKRRPAESLPAGQYDLRFLVSETPIRNATARMEIPKNGEAAVQLNIASPGFQFALADPAEWDPETRAVCERQGSQIDAMDPLTWLSQPLPRLARKACLLNLLAKARSLPSARPGESLCPLIESIHWADVDRIDVKGAGLLPKLRSMTDWKDPAPVHPAHAQTLSSIFGGSPGDYSVESFREPVSERSMQVVVGTHRSSGLEYAEFDIDLGNPGVDLAGLCIHIGELIDPGRTNHLDLYPHLRAGAASDFMYYKLEMASGQVAAHGKS